MDAPRSLTLLLLLALLLSGCSGGGSDGDATEDTTDDATDDGTDDATTDDTTDDDVDAFDADAACAGSGPLSDGDFWDSETTIVSSAGTQEASSHIEVTSVSNTEVRMEGTSSTAGVEAEIVQLVCPASLGLKSVQSSGSVQGFSYSSTTSYDPPCNSLRMPVTADDEYTYTCHATVNGPTGQSSFDQSTHVTVIGPESVTVAAGTFDAMKIEVTMQQDGKTAGTQTWWYADEACTSVKITGSNPDGVGSYTYELTDYECSG